MRAARVIRQNKGLTLREVERATGIDRGNLSRFEQGRTGMLQSNLQTYARCLGVSVDALLEPVGPGSSPAAEIGVRPADGQEYLTATEYPALARIWDNESDAIYDSL